MSLVSDRARDRMILLAQQTDFDYEVGMKLLRESEKSEDEVFNVLLSEIELSVMNGTPIHVAGRLMSEIIATQLGWKLPTKIPDRSGPNSIALSELTELAALDKVEYYRWMNRLKLYRKVQESVPGA